MTYFLFDQDVDQVQIVTDTLVVDQDDRPVMFAHKVWSLPTLNMVMAVTGASRVGDEFYRILSTTPGPRDVRDVDSIAPDLLRVIDTKLRADHGDIGTATIYMFGFPRGSASVVRYIYRSMLNYTSDQGADPATAVRPAPATFTAPYPSTLDDHIALAVQVREENDNGSSPEPVRIGGDLYLTTFRNGLCGAEHIYRFPDHDDHEAAMAARNAR